MSITAVPFVQKSSPEPVHTFRRKKSIYIQILRTAGELLAYLSDLPPFNMLSMTSSGAPMWINNEGEGSPSGVTICAIHRGVTLSQNTFSFCGKDYPFNLVGKSFWFV